MLQTKPTRLASLETTHSGLLLPQLALLPTAQRCKKAWPQSTSSGSEAAWDQFVPSTRLDTRAKFGRRDHSAATSTPLAKVRHVGIKASAAPRVAALAPLETAQPTLQDQSSQTQILVDQNKGLVHHLARRLGYLGLSSKDLVGEGMVALQRAANHYEPSLGVPFHNYAWPAVARAMQQAAQAYSRPVRVPTSSWTLMLREPAVRAKLEATLGRSPKPVEVAAELGIPDSQLYQHRHFSVASLSDPVLGSSDSPDSQLTLADLAAEEDEAEQSGQQAAWQATLSELLDYLPARQRRALELRYGVGAGEQGRSMAEVAAALEVSQPVARALLRAAVRTLRALSAV